MIMVNKKWICAITHPKSIGTNFPKGGVENRNYESIEREI